VFTVISVLSIWFTLFLELTSCFFPTTSHMNLSSISLLVLILTLSSFVDSPLSSYVTSSLFLSLQLKTYIFTNLSHHRVDPLSLFLSGPTLWTSNCCRFSECIQFSFLAYFSLLFLIFLPIQ